MPALKENNKENWSNTVNFSIRNPWGIAVAAVVILFCNQYRL